MLKRLILMGILSTLVLSACTSQNQPKTYTLEEYFPFQENRHQIFAGEGNEYAAFETYVDYIDGNKMQERKINGGTISISVYSRDLDTISRVFFEGESYGRWSAMNQTNREEILLKSPLKVGTTWKVQQDQVEAERAITSVDYEVHTAMGVWKCIEVTTRFEHSTLKEYYAPTVGLVQQVFTNSQEPSSEIRSILVKTEKEVKYPTMIRVYYPEFELNSLLYTEIPVLLSTNQEMAESWMQEMKKAPQGSSLLPIFSENTRILHIQRVSAENRLVLNLSKEFVSEMNAGTTLEALLLKSIAATFGYHYQVSWVELQIDGKPYASGHVELEPGQALPSEWQDYKPYLDK